ncbi:MAG TPA: lytic transglycosylase domain-containing protein [Methylomirabilota bacterium]|nr:lytic transglycosylase domain-containing protein [Methylomirabilota bacterium]
MRLRRTLCAAAALAGITVCAGPARADYIVLRSGQRLAATSYERRGDVFRLQVSGGYVDVPVADVVSIEPEEVFGSVPAPEAKEPFAQLIREAARRHGVDEDLVTCVIAVESNFNARAVSRRNAQGLMQLLPETATRLGVKNTFDPKENIEAGTVYLRELLERYNNDMVLALAAYNAGPERVERFGSVPPFQETRSYVSRITRAFNQKKSRKQNPKQAIRAARTAKGTDGQPL